MITVGFCTKKHNENHIKHLIEKSGLNKKNIEIIEIINEGDKSLTECYNEILKMSQNNIVIFCHDDITILTNNFAKKIIDHFKSSPEYGILGVAGTTFIGESGCWWEKRYLMVGIVEHTDGKHTWKSKYSHNFGDDIVQTQMVDGVFFAVAKDRIKYNFDEELKGFHFYDVDFSFGNHIKKTKVGVIFNVRIRHKSLGAVNDAWAANRDQFKEKWKSKLSKQLEGTLHFSNPKIRIQKEPKLAIIILNKSNNKLLFQCLDSIKNKTTYNNYKIYIGDTGSSEKEIEDIKEYVKERGNVTIHEIGTYNFAQNNNKIVTEIIDPDTELLIFSNNDIELQNDAVSIMVDKYIKNKKIVGTIGCRLHFADNKIQHAGIVVYHIKKDNQIALTHKGLDTYYNYAEDEECFGSTGAFLLISKILFNSLGKFPEKYKECFEDVELNVKALIWKKKNFIMNSAVAYHYESSTRNQNPDKNEMIKTELQEKLVPFLKENMNKIKYYVIPV